MVADQLRAFRWIRRHHIGTPTLQRLYLDPIHRPPISQTGRHRVGADEGVAQTRGEGVRRGRFVRQWQARVKPDRTITPRVWGIFTTSIARARLRPSGRADQTRVLPMRDQDPGAMPESIRPQIQCFFHLVKSWAANAQSGIAFRNILSSE